MPKKKKKKKNFFSRIQISILKKKTIINEKQNPGWRQCQVSRVIRSVQLRPTHHSVILMYFSPPSALPDLKPTRFLVNEADTSTQSAQASIESKYSTLHTCGTKVLPCEEDGVVVVLGVVGVEPLLCVGPSAHLLQAARRVATLDQTDGLREARRAER